jgi:hypothetical protein
MYRIKTDSLTLRLEILRVDALKPHETVLPQMVSRLSAEFQNRANLNNPIIVDQNLIVLDGNHRAHVFRQLGFRYIPVCRINYLNPAAKLRYWYRMMPNVTDSRPIFQAVATHGGRLSSAADQAEMHRLLRQNPLHCGLQHRGRHWVLRMPEASTRNAVAAYEWVDRLQSAIARGGIAMQYVPCRHARDPAHCRQWGPSAAILWTPLITKEMVVAAAGSDRVFPPKSTRHIIPARPLNVNVSSRWFNDAVSEDEINQRFARFLENKTLLRFGPGQVLDGRFYEEELYVFRDRRQHRKPTGPVHCRKGQCHECRKPIH